MKWLSAGLTFVNVTTICGCLEGIAAHGLNKTVAASSAIAGLVAALLAFWGTTDSPVVEQVEEPTPNPVPESAASSEALSAANSEALETNPGEDEMTADSPSTVIEPEPSDVPSDSMRTPESEVADDAETLDLNEVGDDVEVTEVTEVDEVNEVSEVTNSASALSSSTATTTVAAPVTTAGATAVMSSAAAVETAPSVEALPPRPVRSAPRKHWKYGSIWLWAVIAVFVMFAVRSFCNVFFTDGNEYKIQNPNNLGDLSLHITYIKNFASGVPMWPDNPIYAFSKLRYPAGIDLFNAILLCLDISVIRGLVCVGLGASAALCYALYRWGGAFTIAGFLFNGGVAGWQWFRNYEWKDFQSSNYIAWKSLALTMLVTQRGLLYALPAGLLLLCHWRAKFFPLDQRGSPNTAAPASPAPSGSVSVVSRGLLPFWVELSLYATMPLFHVHTFMALSFVLLFLFLFVRPRARKQLLLLGLTAFVPATFFLWLITDHFHAGSVMSWNPGWVQDNGDFARPLAAFTSQPTTVPAPGSGFFGTVKHFFTFWSINFGLTIPILIALVVVLVMQAWRYRGRPAAINVRLVSLVAALAGLLIFLAAMFAYLSLGYSLFVVLAIIPPVGLAVMMPLFASLLQRSWRQTIPLSTPLAFVIPAVVLFIFSCLVKTAPWEWDNIKLIIWSYLIMLPFVWTEVMSRWAFPIRAVVCIALFGSGFFTLFGGLAAGRTGYGMADRAEIDAVDMAVKKIPLDARFAAYPTFNHPILLAGRKAILGYPGHIWTQGFSYGDDNNKLTTLMNGAPDWRQTARFFHARYLFWGREEIKNYPQSKKPWEQECKVVVTGPWGTIYDLESPKEPPAPVAAPSPAASAAPPAAASPATTPAGTNTGSPNATSSSAAK